MSTKNTAYAAVRKAASRMTEARIKKFVESLRGNLPSVNGKIQWASLKGREFPASVIDNWLRRAESDGRLEGLSLNRVAFEVWKRLEELGAEISGHDRCQIIPDPDIESKIARAVEKEFAR